MGWVQKVLMRQSKEYFKAVVNLASRNRKSVDPTIKSKT